MLCIHELIFKVKTIIINIVINELKFSNLEPKKTEETLDNYIIDGFTHCLWWTDPHIEIAFTTPTDRILPRKQQASAVDCDLFANCIMNVPIINSDEHSDSGHAARMLQHDFGSLLNLFPVIMMFSYE